MAAKRKVLWITLAILVSVFIAAIVAVRVALAPDKLKAIVLPRVEKMVGAEVAIGDIKINFPFGFGVDVADLRFNKTLPDTTVLDFSSETVTVRASLLSLLRRKPEISSASVHGGSVALVNVNKARETRLRGLEALVSVKPSGDLFVLRAKARADSVLVSRPGMPPAILLESVELDGEFETDRGLSRLAIKDARLLWAELVSARIVGEVTDVKTAPRLALSIEGDERPIGPVLAAIRTFRMDELSPPATAAPKAAGQQPPPEITGGTLRFTATIEGLAREPLGMNIAFEANLDDASLRAGDLAAIEKIAARVKGAGNAFAWKSLMPSAARPLTLEQITLSWQAIELEGTIDVEGGELLLRAASAPPDSAIGASAAAPLRISALKAKAEISGTGVKSVSGEFRIGASPFAFSGSLANVLPAAAELALVAQKLASGGDGRPVADLGPYLDNMVNAPVVRIEVSGRSFDAQPYQPHRGAKKEAAGVASAAPKPADGGAGAVLLLKNTVFTAKLDSVVTREAILTAVEAKGTIRDGRIRIDPASFRYAGGKGTATVAGDVRKRGRVESSIDFALDGVEAGEALGRLFSLGSLVRGRFSFDSKGSFAMGEGLDPLLSLTAAGSAFSNKGSVSFEKYLGSLSTIQNFDAAPLTNFDFTEWKGFFHVQDGRFVTDDWKIASTAGAWAIKGSFGLDGSLDYVVHLSVPPVVQQRMKNIDAYKSALDLMRDSGGNLILDIRVTGNSKHPSAMLDLTKAKSKAQDKVLEGFKKLLR